ncbi:MAG TPA: sigma factor-like helix-turn-helix DNA-binding protein, partial [Solirubrobacteraceae bacterium]
MSSLERLPPDQRAVLALVLQRGRSYDEIADLLAIDRAAVRDRALAALDALGPTESRIPAERRALITDYLLGQLPGRVRDQVRERLASNPAERAWARVLAGEIGPLARDPLPEIPSSQAASTLEVTAVPEATPEPSATPPPPTPEAAPTPDGEAATTPPLGSGRGLPRPVPVERASSRRGGGLLLAIAALILVVVVIVILATSGGSSPKKSGTTNAGTPTTTSTPTTSTGTGTSTTTTPHVIAQINLRPPSSSSKAAGIAEVVTEGKITGVIVAADHLTPHTT